MRMPFGSEPGALSKILAEIRRHSSPRTLFNRSRGKALVKNYSRSVKFLGRLDFYEDIYGGINLGLGPVGYDFHSDLIFGGAEEMVCDSSFHMF